MHYEVKLYFLRRQPFYAALVYGKESVVARVARPASDPALFAYFAPLLRESRRVLDAPPPLPPGRSSPPPQPAKPSSSHA